MSEDSRLQRLKTQSYLRGVRFHHMVYRAYRPGWDHDHCVGCWAKFAEHGSDLESIEREGYTTGDDYRAARSTNGYAANASPISKM